MSLLTILGDIPLYSTIEEAEAWGFTFGIEGYHTHIYQDQIGYMSGKTHQDIELVLSGLDINVGQGPSMQSIINATEDDVTTEEIVEETTEVITPTTPVVPAVPVAPVAPSLPTTSGSSGGGGGGGY